MATRSGTSSSAAATDVVAATRLPEFGIRMDTSHKIGYPLFIKKESAVSLMSLLELCCAVDDVWQTFAPRWHNELKATGKRKRHRATRLSASEIMTLVIHFPQSQ